MTEQITNDEELDAALERLDEIWHLRPGDEGFEEHEDLVDKITAYEDATVHIPKPKLIDRIMFRAEQSGAISGMKKGILRSIWAFIWCVPLCWLWGIEAFTLFALVSIVYFTFVHWLFDCLTRRLDKHISLR